jgi:hypothetical protein
MRDEELKRKEGAIDLITEGLRSPDVALKDNLAQALAVRIYLQEDLDDPNLHLVPDNTVFQIPFNRAITTLVDGYVIANDLDYDYTDYRYTAPRSGFYQINIKIGYTNNAAGTRYLFIYKNGVQYSIMENASISGANYQHLAMSDQIYLRSGDHLTFYTKQTCGSDLYLITDDSNTHFSVQFIPSYDMVFQLEKELTRTRRTLATLVEKFNDLLKKSVIAKDE